MPDFTQGEWEYRTAEEAGGAAGIYTNYYHDEEVGICGDLHLSNGHVWELTPDDGRLMAAAKELLAVCEVAIMTVECASLDHDGSELPWHKMARKAIAKAYGREGGA